LLHGKWFTKKIVLIEASLFDLWPEIILQIFETVHFLIYFNDLLLQITRQIFQWRIPLILLFSKECLHLCWKSDLLVLSCMNCQWFFSILSFLVTLAIEFILYFQNLFYRSYLGGFFHTLLLIIFKIFNALIYVILLHDTLLSLKLMFIIGYVLDHRISVHHSSILIYKEILFL